ncbi:phage terminase large subunit family protein [Mesorhizobium captivum]|uniref:phage terminase large subunit family protein n=1 Tax=Mesorhizobium captivum TaxID=3072319 RepID=UPI002A2409CA|nr:terminase gpA endonuclease subunit [Mesorhizobium sp. VK23E]MDX8513542.1 phage terminase large subunit family protein [Mesorhizobium sp. VK23E]
MLDIERFLGPLPNPAFARFEDILAEALPSLPAPRRISVPDWAAAPGGRELSLPTYSGPWRNEDAPYMVEPARMGTSRRYSAVVFVGPARTIKTDALVLNTFGHRVCCMPRNMLIVCPTKDMAREFSITKLDPMIRATPAVRSRQARGRGADNLHDKKFAGNMRLRIGWPVIGQVSMVDIPDVVVTDYDRCPDDIDGEGSLFDLARKRTQSFGSLGIMIAESSPGRVVEADDDWQPSSPHEAPPCGGLLSIYNTGTRGQIYWTCPHCKTLFRPRFDTLKWDKKASNGETAKTVYMLCPSGCVIGPDRKRALNAGGIWLHETADGGLVEIDDSKVRDTDTVSYWGEGPIAALQPWDQLVQRFLDATDEFRRTGDEVRLKSTITLDQGRPYRAKVRTVGEGLSPEVLKALAKPYPMRVCPADTRFTTIAVDVQPNRFVVQVDAWCRDLERFLIDRYDIALPPPSAPGAGEIDGQPLRAIDPPRYAEDWDVLFDALNRRYPVEGGAFEMQPAALIVDSHGAEGTTGNAYAFWRKARKKGLAKRVFLQRGRGGVERERATYKQLERVEGKKRARRSDIFVIESGTDPLKDEVALALTRRDPGPGAYHLPDTLGDTVFAEFCAEARTPTGWVEKRAGARNEALDLAVYGKALAIVLKAEKIDWDRPPAWAAEASVNANAFAIAEARPLPTRRETAPGGEAGEAPDGGARNQKWLGERKGWLKR